jgi:hypothetical protein
MRIIKDSKSVTLPEDTTQRFFIQSWFSMAHKDALDSHRIRCMNSVNIIDELMEFLLAPKSNLSGIKEDIARTAAEALEILAKDPIVRRHFDNHWQKIYPLLGNIPPKKPLPDVLAYYLRDFQAELKQNYKGFVIDAIHQEIYESNDLHNLFGHIGSLLSLLIHEGHSIEELFAIIRDIFISNKGKQKYSFDDNFKFAADIISREPSQYDIIFRLQGCRKFDHLKSIMGETIYTNIEIKDANIKVKKFLNPGQNVLFAQFNVPAQDDRSAGLLAKKELDGILDLIRFELENRVISVDSDFISIRKNDNTARRFRLPTIVPNPAKRIEPKHFEDFVDRFNRIFQNDELSTESKEKIRSTLRFYRMGRDSDLFENKFLNWWTALEYLTRTGEKGGIVDVVIKKLISTLLPHYLEKHLISYKNALLFCGIKSINPQISTLELFEIIHDQSRFDDIIMQIDNLPFFKYRLENFKTKTSDPAALSAFIERHEKNLEWHIHRIWRVRCDIVHSAEYSLNLNLLSANLEYYLKSLLGLIIDSFTSKQNIGSIDELYVRYDYANERLHDEMKTDNPELYRLILTGDLF